MSKSVVIIDDEHGTTDLYVKALRMAEFEVRHIDNVKDALAHFQGDGSTPDIYILDLMMPPGDEIKLEESGFGLSTGIVLYRRLREKHPNLPVIILTSVSNPEILGLLPLDDNTRREAKIDVMPFELVEKIKETLTYDRDNAASFN
ncbi:MAG: response regulator [Prosthecobacter sp.]|uniref:response regulator n=1 Tax=Prosthecobacter sp. TaxID=1965333 RepID=UPI0038FD72A8